MILNEGSVISKCCICDDKLSYCVKRKTQEENNAEYIIVLLILYLDLYLNWRQCHCQCVTESVLGLPVKFLCSRWAPKPAFGLSARNLIWPRWITHRYHRPGDKFSSLSSEPDERLAFLIHWKLSYDWMTRWDRKADCSSGSELSDENLPPVQV